MSPQGRLRRAQTWIGTTCGLGQRWHMYLQGNAALTVGPERTPASEVFKGAQLAVQSLGF